MTERLLQLRNLEPIPYRHQNGGDYDDDLVLHDHIRPSRTGLAVHRHD